MKNNRFVALLLVISIFSTLIISKPITVKANNHITFHAEYSGKYDSKDDIIFTIHTINIDKNTFTGHLYYQCQTDKRLAIDSDVSGTITFYKDYYVCSFSCEYHYFLLKNSVSFVITIYPFTGEATGSGIDGFYFLDNNFTLNGTVNGFYDETLSYKDNDMRMCMALSKAIYKDDSKMSRKQSLTNAFKSFDLEILKDELKVYNDDSNPDNVLFAILNRQNDDNSIDMIVVIRGTYKDEWQGNVQITGETYDSSIGVHNNFNEAKKSIRQKIKEYYTDYCSEYENVNLIITGHSRGAAVANLYAKEATDVMNGTLENEEIPTFNNVTAYTFACPNVQKVTEEITVDYMSSYDNIYNFAFTSDLVPYVPLTNPTQGWNYWKYGKCYSMDISGVVEWSDTVNGERVSIDISFPLNS